MLLVAGRKTNLFAEGYEFAVTTENPRLPASNLGNGDPALPAQASNTTSPWDLILDGRLKGVTDPHFDSAWTGAPAGWSKIGSNIVRETAVKDGGVASVRFDYAGAGTSEAIFVAVDVACGAQLDLSCSMRREELALGARLSVMCRNTGLHWPGDSQSWVAEDTDVFDGNDLTADTWGTVSTPTTAPVQVPNLNDVDVATLEIVLRPLSNLDFPTAKNWVDNLRVRPRASLLSIRHPRNVAGAIFTLATSPDQVTWTTRATVAGSAAAREAFANFDPVSDGWWRLRVAVPQLWGGTGIFDLFPGPPAIGEAVLALARSSWGRGERRTTRTTSPRSGPARPAATATLSRPAGPTVGSGCSAWALEWRTGG